jgi:hypothetical protein
MLGLWAFYKDRERKELLKTQKQIDEKRPDGVLDLTNFGQIINKLEPNINDNQILSLYKMALELETGEQGHSDQISADTMIDLITENRIGGYGKNVFTNYLEKIYSHDLNYSID